MRSVLKPVVVAATLFTLAACGGSGSSSLPTDTVRDSVECPGCPAEPAPAAPLLCGGALRVACPSGYHCIDDPTVACDATLAADCSGLCVLGNDLPGCGGLTDPPCEPGYVCVDDPDDTCDGGPAVDCPGVCERAPDGQCSTDMDCPTVAAPCSICADGSYSCPEGRCDRGTCTVSFKACPEPQPCEGVSGLTCEPGFRCVDDPTDDCSPERGGADCRGICLPGEDPTACGGIAGLPCPPGFTCIDNPDDTCDPENNGADCGGHCVPTMPEECTTDAECPPVRTACSVCPDRSEACPRSVCEAGRCTLIVPTCPLPADCGGMMCGPGEVCVDLPDDSCDPATGTQCPSVCQPPTPTRRCGGLTGETCPPSYVCNDDPTDTCDPNIEAADCPGVCEPVGPTKCTSNDECAAVQAPCTMCADGTYGCPAAECRDGICAVVFNVCPQPTFCGGIAGFPCAPGFTCIDDPADDCDPNHGGADCGGVCIREEEPLKCNGFSGATCPEGYACVDDARDDCDPNLGADCPGICRPTPTPPCTSDADCPHIGAPCRMCDDNSAACPHSFCKDGTCRAEFPTCRDPQ